EGPEINRKKSATSEDFDDDGIDDEELVQASFGHLDFDHIDNYTDPTKTINRQNTTKKNSLENNQPAKSARNSHKIAATIAGEVDEPVQLANGKWACNHKCKNRNSCKHLCCKEGTDKPPKKKT